MDTDSSANSRIERRGLHALMRLLPHLHAGATLALCLWLASIALHSGVRPTSEVPRPLPLNGCDCELVAVKGDESASAVALVAAGGSGDAR